MCGIAGILDSSGGRIEPTEIRELTETLAHRGPDGDGIWIDGAGSVALGHRRLAILDTGETGRQPMASADGRHVLTYNGEIYNFLELRAELEAAGHRFVGASDTEVILAAWAEWGEAMLPRFNGMWAFAIHDTVTRETFLARDRFGIKPLLYAIAGRRILFASEMKAFAGLVDGAIDEAVATRLLVDPFGVEGSDRTLLRAVRRLPAGHCARVSGGEIRVRRWWRTLDSLADVPARAEARAERFRELFLDAVRLRLRSDVPVGTCLSGGFDSTAVACAMAAVAGKDTGGRQAGSWREAFVASLPGSGFDETPQAVEAAAHAGIHANILTIGRDDALGDLDRVLDDFDEVYISLPTAPWLIYRELRRKRVLVSLDGHGADELLGAYKPAGSRAGFLVRNLAADLASRSALAARAVEAGRMLAVSARGMNFVRADAPGWTEPLALVGDGDALPRHWGPLNRRLYRMFHGTVLPTILRNFDRLSMAHGVEVRMPFMDWRLVCYAMSLPDEAKLRDGLTKAVARDAVRGLIPETIRTSPRKVGFNSPMPGWLNGPLAGWTESLLARPSPVFERLVDVPRLRRRVHGLNRTQRWNWEATGRLWPYLHLERTLARMGAR